MSVHFPPNRAAALQRLADFIPLAGRDYASRRNYDIAGHPHVSRLSPYLRHRIITEDEVLAATLGRHSPSAAEKFIQEVCWRTYWKGVLERRPTLWNDYKAEVNAGLNRINSEAGLRSEWEAACLGQTGIDCFDHWAQELAETGYLHNHARMWFASIWIFTLRLPWALGADFFLRHLLDGCPASNTLSWRWVAGLQTVGKTYLARPYNIAKYTNGRFNPTGLSPEAYPLQGRDLPPLGLCPVSEPLTRDRRTGLLVTKDDLEPNFLLSNQTKSIAILKHVPALSPLSTSGGLSTFVKSALEDLEANLEQQGHKSASISEIDDIVSWAVDTGLEQVATPYICVGPMKDEMADLKLKLDRQNIDLVQIMRKHDEKAWPSATHGFFRFKNIIPKLLDDDRQPSFL